MDVFWMDFVCLFVLNQAAKYVCLCCIEQFKTFTAMLPPVPSGQSKNCKFHRFLLSGYSP